MKNISPAISTETLMAELLYACISPVKLDLFKKKDLPSLEKISWKQLFKTAEQHKILPQLYQLILQVEFSFIEPEFIEKLQKYHNHRRKRNLLYTYELARLVRILRENQIQAIAFKGPTLSKIAYGDKLGARSFTDLDLLVKQEDYFKVREVLEPHGYKPFRELLLSEGEEKQFYLKAGEYTLHKKNGIIFADIHHRCLGGNNIAFSSDFSYFLKRLEYLDISGTRVLVFSKADTLIYLCMNGIKDGWSSLRHICDIAMLISNSPDLDWEDVNLFAEQLHLQTAVAMSLSLVEFLTGVAPPETNRIKSSKKAEEIDQFSNYIAKRINENLENPSSISLIDEIRMRFFIIETTTDRIRYMRSLISRPIFLLFGVNSVDREFVKIPKYLNFLYYPARLVRVISQYKTGMFKFLIK